MGFEIESILTNAQIKECKRLIKREQTVFDKKCPKLTQMYNLIFNYDEIVKNCSNKTYGFIINEARRQGINLSDKRYKIEKVK